MILMSVIPTKWTSTGIISPGIPLRSLLFHRRAGLSRFLGEHMCVIANLYLRIVFKIISYALLRTSVPILLIGKLSRNMASCRGLAWIAEIGATPLAGF